MSAESTPRHALIFGASGLIGRHLVMALAKSGANVTAAVRTTESGTRVLHWLRARGLTQPVNIAIIDFDAPEIIEGGAAIFADITEIHNCAGSFRFGMPAEEARAANVGIVEKVIDFASGLPELRRLMHISGYRVGGQDPTSVPWSDEHRAAVYAELGGYEASKVESDAVFQAWATERGIPWTIVNPATVIGDSSTGESDQHIGIATTIEQMWQGTAPALPAGKSTFVPVLTVDYMATFMAAAAVDPEAAGRAYWILDDATPPLEELFTHIGLHLGAKVPSLRIPVGIIKRLPRWATKADPETLGFLSSDRYPTGPAIELAAKHRIAMPDVRVSLERWSDYMAAHRFGSSKGDERRIIEAGGVRTFELGESGASSLIFPGLPVNADTWAEVAAGIGARAVDLPGLGLSGGSGVRDWERWLPALLGDEPVELIGHSIGAAVAVLAADRFPSRISSLTLVAPFFLQPFAGAGTRLRPLVSGYLRSVDATQLSHRLTGSDASAAMLESTVDDLKRGRASNVARYLALAGSKRWRAELESMLKRFAGPIRIITGSNDPLSRAVADELAALPNVSLVSVPGARHHPQLTHSDDLIELLKGSKSEALRLPSNPRQLATELSTVQN